MAIRASKTRQGESNRKSIAAAAGLDGPEIHHSGTRRADRLREEMLRLVLASQEGRLTERGHVEEFEGNDRTLLAGVNSILDALTAPLHVAADYVEKISRGVVPDK